MRNQSQRVLQAQTIPHQTPHKTAKRPSKKKKKRPKSKLLDENIPPRPDSEQGKFANIRHQRDQIRGKGQQFADSNMTKRTDALSAKALASVDTKVNEEGENSDQNSDDDGDNVLTLDGKPYEIPNRKIDIERSLKRIIRKYEILRKRNIYLEATIEDMEKSLDNLAKKGHQRQHGGQSPDHICRHFVSKAQIPGR